MLGDGATMQLYNTFSGLPWTQAAMLSARIGTCVLLFKYKTLSRFAESQGPLIITVCGLSLGAAVDLMVSLSLIADNRKMHVVEILQSYVINSGVLTIICQLALCNVRGVSSVRWQAFTLLTTTEVVENSQLMLRQSHQWCTSTMFIRRLDKALSQLNAAYCVLPEAWPKAQNGRAPFLYSSAVRGNNILNDKPRSPDLNSRSITVHLDVRMNLVLPRTNAFGAVVCHITEDELLGDGE
ncbi:hypothetical protein IEO21_06330 [Rhodonia placenta]|nr:hypothetical protein IEO21_06330 [Postia placenta]